MYRPMLLLKVDERLPLMGVEGGIRMVGRGTLGDGVGNLSLQLSSEHNIASAQGLR